MSETQINSKHPMAKKHGRPTSKQARVKQKYLEEYDFLVGCTPNERAYAVRLVRLLRTNYWFSNFMEQMLDLEAGTPFQVTFETVETQMERLKELESLVSRVQFIGATGNIFCNHPAIRAIREEWTDVAQYKSESAAQELVDSAKAQKAAAQKAETEK